MGASAPTLETGKRYAVRFETILRIAGPKNRQAVGLRVRQGTKQHGIANREHRCYRADAERERSRNTQRPERRFAEESQGVPGIGEQSLHFPPLGNYDARRRELLTVDSAWHEICGAG